MKFSLSKDLEKHKKEFVIVEGKNDKKALEELGFSNIFVLNESGRTFEEKIEEIEELAENKKICILTDFDKKGKELYLRLKAELSQRRVKMDNTLRGILLKNKISHIEGLKI